MLAHLAFYYKLELGVLRALAVLLSLLSTWFNVTLGAHFPLLPPGTVFVCLRVCCGLQGFYSKTLRRSNRRCIRRLAKAGATLLLVR